MMIWTLRLQDNNCYVFGNSAVIRSRSVQLHNLSHTSRLYSQHTTYTYSTCILFIYL